MVKITINFVFGSFFIKLTKLTGSGEMFSTLTGMTSFIPY